MAVERGDEGCIGLSVGPIELMRMARARSRKGTPVMRHRPGQTCNPRAIAADQFPDPGCTEKPPLPAK
jgi:hypothetical protein